MCISTVFGGELASGYLGHAYSNREQNWSRRFDDFHLTSSVTPSEPPASPAISSAAVPLNTPNALPACHESSRSTKVYDRTSDTISLDEIERIII